MKNKKRMAEFKRIHGTSVIPPGIYCYENGMCPYWDEDRRRSKQDSGYCHFLERGDWNTNHNYNLVEIKTGKIVSENPPGLSLLWDQCKECGINTEDSEEQKERLIHVKLKKPIKIKVKYELRKKE